jgi:hypothetical protein
MMSRKSVFCIVTSLGQTNRIVDQLKFWKFLNNDISVAFYDKRSSHEVNQENHKKAPKSSVTGSIFGGALGRMTGIGTKPICGVDSIIDSGPILIELSQTAGGEEIEGVDKLLLDMNIPENQSKGYEDKIRAGYILISVYAENLQEIALANDIFTRSGAEDIRTTGEASKQKKKGSSRSRMISMPSNNRLQKMKSFLRLG